MISFLSKLGIDEKDEYDSGRLERKLAGFHSLFVHRNLNLNPEVNYKAEATMLIAIVLRLNRTRISKSPGSVRHTPKLARHGRR